MEMECAHEPKESTLCGSRDRETLTYFVAARSLKKLNVTKHSDT